MFSDKARLSVASDAAGHIEARLRMLAREIRNDEDSDSFERTLESSLKRMLELNSVVLSVVGGDDHRTTDEMKEVVYL